MSSPEPPKITAEMSREAQADLIERLNLEEIDQDLYRGYNEPNRTGRIFGGQVAAQSLMAAGRTVGDMLEIHAHACPLYLVAVGLASVAWAALTYFDAPPSAFV